MSKAKPHTKPATQPNAKLKVLLASPWLFAPARPSVDPRVQERRLPYDGKPYLPTEYNARKEIPIFTGVIDYFPLALMEVAKVSAAGNAQHNPGEDLHWARGKSMDQMNTALRHMMERGNKDGDGVRHLAKAAWRILAALQIECEEDLGLPISRGSMAAGT